ncbi:MAG: ParB/RepB/Spo0J family partition protein [Caulobacteraceae bacterium]|nr:ParB/RepB/Spo0J family partition protein [Caulobacteraceae bacterium]
MAERRGLGRGLSALLDETAAGMTASGPIAGAGVRELSIELVHRNPDQPRMDFSGDDLDTLAASIRDKGVLQPILVRPSPTEPGQFQIVAGERRWRAAQQAGLHEIPALVRELDDVATLEIGIIENVQRVDLNPVEEAMGYKALIDRFGRTQEDIAQAVGKSRSHVANALRLLGLPDYVLWALRANELSAGHARAIAAAPDPEGLARTVIEEGLSVRAAEALARKAHGAAGKPRAKSAASSPARDADTLALEADLGQILGLAVEIIDRDGAGEVRIRYQTLEQLDDLCRRLTE